ncbi:MAG: amylo-alpha-1,6-glucosidase [Gaiellaceae bacterium]
MLTGSTFCISDEFGDIAHEAAGFFAEDMRYLSLLRVTINGERPLLLTSGRLEHFTAVFYLRNPLVDELPPDALTLVHRRYLVTDALQDELVLENVSKRALELELGIELGCDFADILTVKAHDLSLGRQSDPPPPLPAGVPCQWRDGAREAVLEDVDGMSTRVMFSAVGSPEDHRTVYRMALEPQQRWGLRWDVFPSTKRGRAAPRQEDERFSDEVGRARDSLAAWNLRVPQIRASWAPIASTFERSIADLAALRMHSRESGGQLPAAGAPWFMTIFGRDTIITCLETMLLGPEPGRTALETLAALQASEDDPSIDAEPGKIIHEVRHGKAAQRWFARYYGAADTTPLFLILLSELWRWTDDWSLADRFREPALAALRWIDEYGDRDGDGFVEYQRRTQQGLRNQSWKDSGDSQRFRDGRVADPPIAACEIQGYVYDAKRRIAELARNAWHDSDLADRLEREAEELRRRFDDAYWLGDRGCFALALDNRKQQVDSATSNMGHLLWSGIVLPDRVGRITDHLLGPGLWSGWGVRTMSASDGGYSPLGYHTGTVWPHDNAVIAAGLARAERWPEAYQVALAMFEAAAHFGYQLPEVFSGLPRRETPFPVPYPSASRPQAWAAATPILLLQVVLGLRPDRKRQVLESVAPRGIPGWTGDLLVSGVHAFGRQWDVRLERGSVHIDAA